MGKLDGKIAIVTGAARGIGRNIAEALAREGADLALCDCQVEWMNETVASVQSMGRKAFAGAADVGSATAVEEFVSQVMAQYGRIDILVNNAGITRDKLLIRMSDDDWDQVIRINLTGAFLLSRAVAKIMMKQRSGCMVNIASIIGLIGNAGQCNYAASKAGLIAMSKSMAKELAGRGIRVNAVAPGFIVSKMTDALSEDVRNQMMAAIPAGRFGTADDVAKSVVFLASDDASYVTGQVLSVNGGMVM
ncbi:MAG: 3-oxoacyl-[acyl-carrier-protein] reductase [Magnetococcus sp. WYHC-3]